MASYDEAVPPGQAGTIRTVLKTDHLRGKVSKGIVVTTNDPAAPTINLTMRAEIVGSVVLLPGPYIAMTALDEDRPGRLLVRRDETETGSLALTDVAITAPWLTITTRRLDGPESLEGLPASQAGDWFIEIRRAQDATKGRITPGSFNEQLTFKTGLTREPQVTIPVNVFVRAAIFVNPAEIPLPRPAPGGAPAEGAAIVGVRPDVDGAALTVTADTPALSVALEPSGNRRWRLKVHWNAGTDPVPDVARVTLASGSESTTVTVRALPAPPVTVSPRNPAQPG